MIIAQMLRAKKRYCLFGFGMSGIIQKIPAFLFSFLFMSIGSIGASEIFIGDFLATAKNDIFLASQREKIDFLKSSSYDTPYFDRIEFRTETDEFEPTQQRYALRVYPNGWGETKDDQDVYRASVQYHKIQRDLFLHQALKLRYILVINFLHNRSMLELKRKLSVLYEDRINVLNQSVHNLNFDVGDLIEAEDDYTGLQLELIDLENRGNSIEDEIRRYIPKEGPVVFDDSDMIGIKLIEKIVLRPGSGLDEENIYLQNSRARLRLAETRYKQEQSESKRYISYLQASYDNEERHDSEEAFSLELGIRLPFVDSNRLATNRRKLRYLTEQGKDHRLKKEIEENLKIITDSIMGLIRQDKVLTEKKADKPQELFFKTYRQIEGVDPLILLKIRESILKRDISREKIKYALYSKYIEFLDASGELSKKPFINYLSLLLEEIYP